MNGSEHILLKVKKGHVFKKSFFFQKQILVSICFSHKET